jgi:ABC-type uncharacterized transport system substrate-binding protein
MILLVWSIDRRRSGLSDALVVMEFDNNRDDRDIAKANPNTINIPLACISKSISII